MKTLRLPVPVPLLAALVTVNLLFVVLVWDAVCPDINRVPPLVRLALLLGPEDVYEHHRDGKHGVLKYRNYELAELEYAEVEVTTGGGATRRFPLRHRASDVQISDDGKTVYALVRGDLYALNLSGGDGQFQRLYHDPSFGVVPLRNGSVILYGVGARRVDGRRPVWSWDGYPDTTIVYASREEILGAVHLRFGDGRTLHLDLKTGKPLERQPAQCPGTLRY